MKYILVIIFTLLFTNPIVKEQTHNTTIKLQEQTIKHLYLFYSTDSLLELKPGGIFIFKKYGQKDTILNKEDAIKKIHQYLNQVDSISLSKKMITT